jgi:CDGSH-type Zn-finger protein
MFSPDFSKEENMAEVIIKTLKDGPLEIWGGAKLADEAGKEYAESGNEPLYLCRCGHSRTKPFCDNSHDEIGFKAEETAG